MGPDGITIQPQISSPNSVDPGVHRLQPWYNAYMAALFESDRSKMAERIRQAEQLIVNRERELRTARPELTERRALENAMHVARPGVLPQRVKALSA